MASRRLRAFKRWMTANSIHWSDALDLIDTDHDGAHGDGSGGGICVKSKCELKEGDLVATIPKKACLTVKTSGAASMIEGAELEGSLALSVAVMYERSLRSDSPWAGYLQLLPHSEPLPLVWTLDEVDCFLRGTELHKTVKEDKTVIYEDWKECILPLIHSDEFAVDPNYFGVEDYFAAKSLVASRSFQIDDYHGYGMVPLADLFNHKTGAEDVHFTLPDESDDGEESMIDEEDDQSDELETQAPQIQENGSSATVIEKRIPDDPDSAYSEDTPGNSMVLEMILVKDVNAGAEVYNTYGIMGNAALLHRYGFTELDNEYDIVNIDLDLVLQWSTSLFSGRHSRSRLSFWRKLGYSGCVSENSEYFEISFGGEPQLELSILLYIILLPEEEFTKLDITVVTGGNSAESTVADLSKKSKRFQGQIAEMSRDMLLTKTVRKALLSLADMRESLYGTTSLQEDVEFLKKCNCITERKLYHSLALRVSERRILGKLRTYAELGCKSLKGEPSKKKFKC